MVKLPGQLLERGLSQVERHRTLASQSPGAMSSQADASSVAEPSQPTSYSSPPSSVPPDWEQPLMDDWVHNDQVPGQQRGIREPTAKDAAMLFAVIMGLSFGVHQVMAFLGTNPVARAQAALFQRTAAVLSPTPSASRQLHPLPLQPQASSADFSHIAEEAQVSQATSTTGRAKAPAEEHAGSMQQPARPLLLPDDADSAELQHLPASGSRSGSATAPPEAEVALATVEAPTASTSQPVSALGASAAASSPLSVRPAGQLQEPQGQQMLQEPQEQPPDTLQEEAQCLPTTDTTTPASSSSTSAPSLAVNTPMLQGPATGLAQPLMLSPSPLGAPATSAVADAGSGSGSMQADDTRSALSGDTNDVSVVPTVLQPSQQSAAAQQQQQQPAQHSLQQPRSRESERMWESAPLLPAASAGPEALQGDTAPAGPQLQATTPPAPSRTQLQVGEEQQQQQQHHADVSLGFDFQEGHWHPALPAPSATAATASASGLLADARGLGQGSRQPLPSLLPPPTNSLRMWGSLPGSSGAAADDAHDVQSGTRSPGRQDLLAGAEKRWVGQRASSAHAGGPGTGAADASAAGRVWSAVDLPPAEAVALLSRAPDPSALDHLPSGTGSAALRERLTLTVRASASAAEAAQRAAAFSATATTAASKAAEAAERAAAAANAAQMAFEAASEAAVVQAEARVARAAEAARAAEGRAAQAAAQTIAYQDMAQTQADIATSASEWQTPPAAPTASSPLQHLQSLWKSISTGKPDVEASAPNPHPPATGSGSTPAAGAAVGGSQGGAGGSGGSTGGGGGVSLSAVTSAWRLDPSRSRPGVP